MTEETKKNFSDMLEDCLEKENGFQEDFDRLDASIENSDELNEALPILSGKMKELKEKVSFSSDKEKLWNDNKKAWEVKQDHLLEYASHLLNRFSLKSAKVGECKIQKTTRNVLKVDSDAILAGYKGFLESLTRQLPPYIKVSVTVDKKAMADYVKNEPDFLNDCPNLVHWEESESVSMK